MTPGRRIHLGKQVIEERRHLFEMVRLPPTVVNPGIGERFTRRWPGKGSIDTDTPNRITVAPALKIDKLTRLGPIGHKHSD